MQKMCLNIDQFGQVCQLWNLKKNAIFLGQKPNYDKLNNIIILS